MKVSVVQDKSMALIAFRPLLLGNSVLLQVYDLKLSVAVGMHQLDTEQLHEDHVCISQGIRCLTEILLGKGFLESRLDRLVAEEARLFKDFDCQIDLFLLALEDLLDCTPVR